MVCCFWEIPVVWWDMEIRAREADEHGPLFFGAVENQLDTRFARNNNMTACKSREVNGNLTTRVPTENQNKRSTEKKRI